jgi:transcriptional regulator with XRE-family HTH domain
LTEVSFGEWLKRKRKALDLTREGLADRVGYSAETIRKLETEERRPLAQMVEQLAEIFDIPSDERAAFLRFAILAATQDQMERAARLFGAVETLHASIHFEMSAKEHAEHDQAIASARAALGEEVLAAAWAEGCMMTMEHAIDYAIEAEDC